MTTQLTDNMRTAEALFGMFTENTGISFMDSGGDSGRHWQRNQGLSLSDFMGGPSATWERNWSVTISAFRFCLDRLNYSKSAEVLTRLMNVWEEADSERNLYGLDDQADYLASLGATADSRHFNTYNFDNALSQDLQGLHFELGGRNYVLLQVHGGADARGGYTRPVVFEANEYWLMDCDRATLYCESCHLSGDSTNEWGWYRHGELPPTLFGEAEREFYAPEGYDTANGCPECGGDLTAEMMEVY